MILKLRHYCQFLSKPYLKKKGVYGFSLVELLLSLAIMSILFLSFYSIFEFVKYTYETGDEIDELLINGQYSIEYIKNEVRQAAKIISIDKIEGLEDKYPDNIGFVIVRYYPEHVEKYNYSTYYLKNNKIYRIAENRSDDRNPIFSGNDGHNLVAEYVFSMKDTNINYENKILDLNLVFKKESEREMVFKSRILIRCPIIY